MIVKASKGQTIFDIAVIYSGIAEAAYGIAYDNGLSVSEELSDGQFLRQTQVPYDKKVIEFFSGQLSLPATGGVLPDVVFDFTFDNTFN